MKYLIFFNFLILFQLAHGYEQLKLNLIDDATSTLVYEVTFDNPSCATENDCALLLGAIRDGYSIKINDQIVIDEIDSYLSFESILVNIPASLISESNLIRISIKNNNGGRFGVGASGNIYIGSLSNLRFQSFYIWFVKTGLTLSSIYVLIVVLVMLMAISFLTFNKYIFALIGYSLVSTVYLISFSEIPRFFAYPEVLSGVVHFSLRLAQDLCLFLLFNFYLGKQKKNSKFVYLVIIIYLFAIGLMVLPAWVFGILDFKYHLGIIKIFAPLVALPMAYGFALSLYIKSKFEKKVMIPLTSLLFLMQLNDLFVFWQFYKGVYTVKFYIPLVVLTLLFIYLSRQINKYNQKLQTEQSARLAIQIAHDIKSPVMAINLISSKVRDHTLRDILIECSTRINDIANSILPGHNKKRSIDVKTMLLKIYEQKKIEHINLNIKIVGNSFNIFCVQSDFERLISNLLNNTCEANSNSPHVEIALEEVKKWNIIKISDNAGGISDEVLSKIGLDSNSIGKKTGSGLGLSGMVEIINSYGGKYEIRNNDIGVEIKIYLPRH